MCRIALWFLRVASAVYKQRLKLYSGTTHQKVQQEIWAPFKRRATAVLSWLVCSYNRGHNSLKHPAPQFNVDQSKHFWCQKQH